MDDRKERKRQTKGILAVALILFFLSSCEYADIITPGYDTGCPDVVFGDLDRMFVAAQLSNPDRTSLGIQKTALPSRGAHQLVLYFWQPHIVLKVHDNGMSGGHTHAMVRLNDTMVEYIDTDFEEDLSGDGIIDLDKHYNPINPNEWVQFADEAPRATGAQIERFELVDDCLGGIAFHRDSVTGVHMTRIEINPFFDRPISDGQLQPITP